MAERENRTLYVGDTGRWTHEFLEDDEETPLAGLDLTTEGYEFRSHIRAGQTADDPVVASATVVATNAYTLVETLTAAESRNLIQLVGQDPGWWDLEVTDPDGEVTTWKAGRVKVTGDASRGV